MSVRVVIADDQRMVRDGLVLLLGSLPDIDLVGTAADGLRALELVVERRPEVVLMDLRMPHMDGIEATRRIRRAHPDVHVIALTTYADDASVFGALQAGARGYLTKDAGAEEIAHAIHTVAAGQALLDPSVQARLLEHLDGQPASARPPVAGRPPAAARPDTGAPPDELSNREIEVLRLVADGLSNAEIAKRLVVTQATVKTHINHIFAKTGVRDRAQAVRYAYRQGLATP